MRLLALPLFLLFVLRLSAQDINVEYDKNRDLSIYKTFSLGEGEVITPKDKQQVDAESLTKWIREALVEELKEKGLQQVDSAADLVASFVVGSQDRTDVSQLGPLGLSPGNDNQTWSHDYRMASVIIDLDDRRDNLIWRINATAAVTTTDYHRQIEQIVGQGFKKFSIKPKKKKK
jgi:hypothetical protein